MKNKEVVEILKHIKCTAFEDRAEALQHAIRCMELMPKLINELEYAVYFVHNAGKYNNASLICGLIDEAKELIE